MLGEPRQRVDNRLMMVDTDAGDFVSVVLVLVLAPGVPVNTYNWSVFQYLKDMLSAPTYLLALASGTTYFYGVHTH